MPSSACYSVLWFLGTGLLATSCQDAPSEAGQLGKRATPKAPAAPLAMPAPLATRAVVPQQAVQNRPEPRPTWYRFEDDTLRRTLRVVQVSTRIIQFRLVDSLKTTGKFHRLEGTATALVGDPEIDEDEDGTAYPSVAYNHEGACFLSVRIELNTRQRVQLGSGNCHTAHPDGTFGHGGILYRVSSNKQ